MSYSSLTRRQLLAGFGAAGAATLLGACGASKSKSISTRGVSTNGGSASGGSAGGAKKVTMLNWVLYIENDADPPKSPTIRSFTDATGIRVDYRPEIDGNDSFYTKYEPQFSKGKGIGADIAVLTAWMAARMIAKGFALPFTGSHIPNKANLLPDFANPPWDPGRKFSLPWATVLAGIAYYPDKCGFELKSVNDLFDPRLKNRVTVLDEMRDTVGLLMLAQGLDPVSGSIDDMKKAVAQIRTARGNGQIRKVTGNSYTEDLRLRDTWASIAWAGDAAQLQHDNPDLRWLFPAEGTMRSTDNAMILLGAPNQVGAELFLNHVYDPKVAGPLYEKIQYPSPVKGALANMSAAAKSSPFLNPTGKLVEFRILSANEDDELSKAFAEATQQ